MNNQPNVVSGANVVPGADYSSLFKPERQEGELFADYKERRLLANGVLKQLRRGSRMLWNSFAQGTRRGKFA